MLPAPYLNPNVDAFEFAISRLVREAVFSFGVVSGGISKREIARFV
jgi:hypothetical protein